jgi:predicted glycosyltransferase
MKFPPRAHVINIPEPFDSRATFKGLRLKPLSASRSRFVLETAHRIKPDVFITEFFPFGRLEYLNELLPALRHLHNNGTRIVASIGYPYLSTVMRLRERKFFALLTQVMKLYDAYLIHTPEGLEDSYFLKTLGSRELESQYKHFFRSIADKITYTGYILPKQPPPTKDQAELFEKKPGQFTAVVSRGGGAVYPKIIALAIHAQAILGDRYRFIIASGPSTNSTEKELFLALQKKYRSKNVLLFDYLPNLSYFLEHCDASVSMCGYNTSAQLLHFGTPSVVIPYVGQHSPSFSNDQIARSLLLKDTIGSSVLDHKTMTAETLARAIDTQCRAPRRPAPKEWFNGNVVTVRKICLTCA